VNLAEQMNQLADAADLRLLPDAEDIRRTGDGIRRRRRTRLSVGAAALAVLAVVATLAITSMPASRPAPQPAGTIDGWFLARTLTVPGTGATVTGAGSVWVVDMQRGELMQDGRTPAGSLYQVDPATGEVLDRVTGAVGGWPTIGGGAIWLCTAVGDLNLLTRVDLQTHDVTQLRTSSPAQLPHGTALAQRNLWAANWASGDLVRLDPTTGQARQTIHLGDGGSGQAPSNPMSDGHSVWVASHDGLVTRFDGATGTKTSQLQLPAFDVALTGIDPARHVLYAQSRATIYEISTTPGRREELARELDVTPHRVDVTIAGSALGTGALWVATLNPDELLRIDPTTLHVTGRMPLTGIDHGSNVPVALAAADRSVWVRLPGKVLQLSPGP
jgi:hypothetical protein